VVIISELVRGIIMDIIRYERNYYVHKQVEKRNGRIYIRMKKRSFVDNT